MKNRLSEYQAIRRKIIRTSGHQEYYKNPISCYPGIHYLIFCYPDSLVQLFLKNGVKEQ